MTDYNRESQIGVVVQFFRNNPGLMISVAYLLLTLCGIIYAERFYGEFGIAILKMADVSDFLIAGISDLSALVMFAGGILVAWIFDRMSQYSFGVRSRWLKKPKSLLRSFVISLHYVPKSNKAVFVGLLAIFICYAYIFVSLYADWRSTDIRNGHGHKIHVQTKSDSTIRPYTLLGSTSNYLLVYETQSESAKIIPIDYVVEMTPVIEKKKEAEETQK